MTVPIFPSGQTSLEAVGLHMTYLDIAQLAISILAAAGLVVLFMGSVRGASRIALLSPLVVAGALVSAVYAGPPVALAGAGAAVGVGLGGALSLLAKPGCAPDAARRLRLTSTACCAVVGALLAAFPFPVEPLGDRLAWVCAGGAARWAYAVFASPSYAGRAAVEPPRAAKHPSAIPWATDAAVLLVCVAFAVVQVLHPYSQGTVVVVLVMLFAGFLTAMAQHLGRPGGFLHGPPTTGAAWISMVVMFVAWGLTNQEGTPEAHAWGWVLMGAGTSQAAWILLVRPRLSGYAMLPQCAVTLFRRRSGVENPEPEGSEESEGDSGI